MALLIEDGDPWWLSPNVWAVDQASPDDPSPGVVAPMVGTIYLLKAVVRNDAPGRVENARVDFFWADPSVGITRTSASAVGSAFVTIEGNDVAEALCLVPWSPSFVNGGHICIVAAVVAPGGTATNALDAPTDPRVAQRNFDLVLAIRSRFAIPFSVCNPTREPGSIEIALEPIKPEALAGLGIQERFEGLDAVKVLGFARHRCPEGEWREQAIEPVLKLDALACSGMTLIGEIQSPAAAFSVVGRIGERVIGGFTVLVKDKVGKQS